MAAQLQTRMKEGESLLVFSPLQEPGHLAQELEKREISFKRVPLYETIVLSQDKALVEADDWFAFASASAVRGLTAGEQAEAWKGKMAVCIGEKTAEEAKKSGFCVRISKEATMESMVETFVEMKEINHVSKRQ